MHGKKLYGTATVGSKGQVVIPSEAREQLGINAGDRLYVIGSCEAGYLGLLKEEQLSKFVEKMSLQLEEFKSINVEAEK